MRDGIKSEGSESRIKGMYKRSTGGLRSPEVEVREIMNMKEVQELTAKKYGEGYTYNDLRRVSRDVLENAEENLRSVPLRKEVFEEVKRRHREGS